MLTELARLEQVLHTRRPAFFARFRPGVTQEELDALPPAVLAAIDPQALALYRWRNGHPRDLAEGAFQNCADFCSLAESVQVYLDLTGLLRNGEFDLANWWSESWFPLLHGPSGDYLCVDSAGTLNGTTGQLIDHQHNDPSRNIVAPSVAAWITSYCDLLEADLLDDSGCASISDELVWSYHLPGYPKVRSAGP